VATDTDTAVAGPEEPPVPLIDEALAGRCPNPNQGSPLPQGDDLRRVSLTGPGRCNDGTPPVLFVRAATDPAHENDWIWFFDGGSVCTHHEGCAVRWCGEDPPYGARHMSSRFAPYGIGGVGIDSTAADNSFAGWNQVFAMYCSSDAWSGARGEYVFEGEPDYRLYFEGGVVAADGIDAGVAGLASDDGVEVLPSLADAATIIVSGTSAGSYGAVLHRSKFVDAAPSATTLTLVDSAYDSAHEVIDPATADLLTASDERGWTDAANPAWGTEVEPACLATFPTEPWLCMNLVTLLGDGFVEGRVFWHHDLLDPVIYKNSYGPMGLTEGQLSIDGVATFRFFEDEHPDVSLHAFTCGEHTTIDSDGGFQVMRVSDAEAGGPFWSIHDALAAFVDGQRVVAIDTAPSTTSICQ
jgi:hypothetical protein